MNLLHEESWVPEACTLPTAERPLRVEAFDEFFARDVLSVDRTAAGRVRLAVRPNSAAAGRAAVLAAEETGCCSFFDFDLAVAAGEVTLSIAAPAAHADVVTALGDRAARLAGKPSR